MKKILLACSAGMSTSLLVSKMEAVANERGLDAKIWAVAQDKAPEDMKEADVLLIGPQMRFMKKKFEKTGQELGVPVDVIDSVSYGRIDGSAVLDHAIKLIEKN
ncbi:PTS system oligo-beta-mannoside-specific EIIB component [Halolactibacillus miurensis]|uniref:PTS system oligo-beta-mannoside-specific EIIB component n=1 Tax=Halolactibacillus miurensis TaxID=306541 RepID=A0A1I6PBP2_9BACI|nr:PTS sugar transporter subunit IIB [Halolactibacillus miurensis]GEM05302.1 PTS system oligo-beta-mannoside-specific EIIB component [Halolactibacillus miurensis]SFS37560.1 PTS system, cellobiose-specific IIB component [Halolactibacillus miurensis]